VPLTTHLLVVDFNHISDSYSSFLARAKNLLASQRFPRTALSLLESDISSTLPQLHIFHALTGPLYSDLRDLLCAWVVSRADEGLGYVEGVAKVRLLPMKHFHPIRLPLFGFLVTEYLLRCVPDRWHATTQPHRSCPSVPRHAQSPRKRMSARILWWSCGSR